MRNSNRNGRSGALTLLVLLAAGAALATTPQTIVVDGVNDFLPVNLVDLDAADTEFTDIDLSNVHLTNDAVNLYVGIQTGPGSRPTNQIGMAIDVGTVDGGTADPWGRAIEWSLATNKPDFMFYVNLDNNWQAGLRWDGAAWVNLAEGTGSLGMATGTDFKELAIMLGTLGVSAGATINFETWMTQDSTLRGPLDCAANDGSQLSTPTFTLWDTDTPISLETYLPYAVQAAADPDPPLLANVAPAAYPVDSFFDVFFNEPVDAATANVAVNYDLLGATVLSATRDAGDPSVVHLQLSATLSASANLYTVTVTGVQDAAGNTIVDDGVGNVSCFGLKDVTFRGKMSQLLANTAEVPPYTFSVEGGKVPLTFSQICDTGLMTDTGVDDIWQWSTVMAYSGDCASGTASETFEWKFNFQCGIWEGLANNRLHTLDLANGAADVIDVWWADEGPTQFTTHDIDVEFFVDMSMSAYADGDTVGLNGSVAPLNFNRPPEIRLVDDGSGNDSQAGDMIFSTLVRFPAGARKDVTYKFLLNSEYECLDLPNRDVFLNDELYDTVGGALGPLTLPVVTYDFCNQIWRAVEVVFSVDFNGTAWQNLQPSDVVTINGTPNGETPTFDWSVPSLTELQDDGVAPDAVAGDKIYSVAVVFPTANVQNIEYKYLFNDVYECSSQGNRNLALDPDNHDAVDNPQVLATDIFQRCGGTDVPLPGAGLLSLSQNHPNPFNPSTEIHFSVTRAGQGDLAVFNLRGQTVRTLKSGQFEEGPGMAIWDGRNDTGQVVGSGVYFYRLSVGQESLTRQMVLLK